jgi:hypothetical protein
LCAGGGRSRRVPRVVVATCYPIATWPSSIEHDATDRPSSCGHHLCTIGYDTMSVEELQAAVSQLPAEELERFSRWFEEFQAEQWNRRIEADIRAGHLDAAGLGRALFRSWSRLAIFRITAGPGNLASGRRSGGAPPLLVSPGTPQRSSEDVSDPPVAAGRSHKTRPQPRQGVRRIARRDSGPPSRTFRSGSACCGRPPPLVDSSGPR